MVKQTKSVLFIVLILLVSCQNQNTKTQQKEPFKRDFQEIWSSGKIVALTDNSTTSYFIYRGQPMGFEYELLSLYAKSRNLRLEMKLVDNIDDIFNVLNSGGGDIVAANLTITKERAKQVAFTLPHLNTHQVLVQKLPENYWKLNYDQLEKSLIRNPIDLLNETISVRKNSSFYTRIINLSEEIGGEIYIQEAPGNLGTEDLIEAVAKGEIKFTVADENIALLNQKFHKNIDVKTPISFDQFVAWAVRKNAPELQTDLNNWIVEMRKTNDYHAIYSKYFKARTQLAQKAKSDLASGKDGISVYDNLIKKYAATIHWDWRLLASLIYQESKFDSAAQSWTGATGLMQILPETANDFSQDSMLTNPTKNLEIGTKYINRLTEIWTKKGVEEPHLTAFVLASYNVGIGHLIDARALATKFEKNPNHWPVIEEMLLLKSKPEFYNDKVVKFGYCRGQEPVDYVKEILERFEHYKNLIE